MANKSGFTIIELMVVVAIIGILAAIAVGNYLAYRDKAYCASMQSDAENIAAALANYFAVPGRVNLPDGNPTMTQPAGLGVTLSNDNTATVGGVMDAITITVKDHSGRCPNSQMQHMPGWDGTNNTYSLTM